MKKQNISSRRRCCSVPLEFPLVPPILSLFFDTFCDNDSASSETISCLSFFAFVNE